MEFTPFIRRLIPISMGIEVIILLLPPESGAKFLAIVSFLTLTTAPTRQLLFYGAPVIFYPLCLFNFSFPQLMVPPALKSLLGVKAKAVATSREDLHSVSVTPICPVTSRISSPANLPLILSIPPP